MIVTVFGSLLVYTRRRNCKSFYQRPRGSRNPASFTASPDKCGPLGSATPSKVVGECSATRKLSAAYFVTLPELHIDETTTFTN